MSTKPNERRCLACTQTPHPTHVLIDVQGELVAVCADPGMCLRRARLLRVGRWER